MGKGFTLTLMTLTFLAVGSVATWMSLAVPLSKGQAPMFGGIIASAIAALFGFYTTLTTPKEDRRRTFSRYSRYGAQDSRLGAILMSLVLGAIAAFVCQLAWYLIAN